MGVVVAHPGHGDYYPDEVTFNDTSSGSSSDNYDKNTNTGSDASSSSSSSSSPSSSDTSSKESDEGTSNTSADTGGVEEVTDVNNSTNYPSKNSDNMPGDILSLMVVFGMGFGAVIALSKLGLLSK